MKVLYKSPGPKLFALQPDSESKLFKNNQDLFAELLANLRILLSSRSGHTQFCFAVRLRFSHL